MSDVLERPGTDRREAGEGDHDRFAHYVRKEALERAILDGVPTVALCGKAWLPTRDAQRFPVCPECREAWEALRDA